MMQKVPKSHQFVGISANGPWMHTAQQHGSGKDSRPVATRVGGAHSFPNAVLLYRFPGEPFRLDMGEEPHPRGSGLSWPPEAIADPNNGTGRLPLGLIIENIESGNLVHWHQDEKYSYRSSEALAGAIAQLSASEGFDDEVVFVIPNNWGEVLQQEIIDAFRTYNLKCKLLWRPIAAALEWFGHFSQDLVGLVGQPHETVGKLLSLYIGYDHLEITELELVVCESARGEVCIVPGRARPTKHERIPSIGFRQVIKYLSCEGEPMRGEYAADTDRFGRVWNRLWCTQAISALQLKPLENEVFSGPASIEFERSICQMEQLNPNELRLRLRQFKSRLQTNYKGVIVSGALANAVFDERYRVWEWIVDSLEVTSVMMLAEGHNSDHGLLARGACRFAQRLDAKMPTYLDTLPRLEMVISEGGEPKWIDLLDPEQKWVDGGRLWKRPERIQNLSIAACSVDLKLAVAHEEFDSMREVVTGLPTTSETAEKVSLSVEIFPAQGKARIELHPDRAEFFNDERVFVDWRRMNEFITDDGKRATKQAYLDGLDRIFPQLLPRVSSATKSLAAKYAMNNLMETMRNGSAPKSVNQALGNARGLLREKDQKMYPQDATAFDSEGKCVGRFSLDDFMEVAWPYYEKHNPTEFVRALAYTHVDHQAYHEHILSQIKSHYVMDDFVVAAGKCFRDAEHVAVFVQALFAVHSTSRLTQTWWKATSEMLRFRGNATKLVSSEDCLKLMQLAGEVFKRERKRGSGKELFRLVCLVIVYTLRRRAYDDSFLAPESELAIWIKGEFRKARADAKSGKLRLIGGSVDLSGQLQLIIDYVDRKGKGQLLIEG